MIRRLFFCVYLMGAVTLFAQTQQGYVKTKGRLGTNGTIIAGTRLSGATVTIKGGNTVVSGNKGTFTLAIPGNNYYLQNVEKNGYVLTDPDVLSKQYAYSKNPLVLVLEDKEQQKADQQATERKIRSNLYAQLQKRNDELEALKEQHQITEEKYRELLQKLNSDQDDNEKLISEMAARYSKMDFDEVDEFNRRISSLILEGKLTEAESLLNTKGDINNLCIALGNLREQHRQEESQTEKQHRQKEKKQKEQNRQEEYKIQEDIAQACYSKFEIFKLRHQRDSAAHYIELRASLDTANVTWLLEVGDYYFHYASDDEKALNYYVRALNVSNVIGDSTYRSDCITNIASVYSNRNLYDKAMEYYRLALSERLILYGEESEQVAASFNNIGAVYVKQRDFEKGKDAIERALSIYSNIPNAKQSDIALCYNNLGYLYSEIEESKMSLECYEKALNIYMTVYGDNHIDVALAYNNIGCIHDNMGQDEKAMSFFKRSIEVKRKVYGEEHPDVALSLSNIGGLNAKLGHYDEAIAQLDSSITMLQKFQKSGNLSVAICYNQLGFTYSRMKDYTNAIKNYTKAIDITKSIFGEEHYDVALYYNNIGKSYYNMGDYQRALENMQNSLKIYSVVLGEQHPQIGEIRKVVDMLQQRVCEENEKNK